MMALVRPVIEHSILTTLKKSYSIKTWGVNSTHDDDNEDNDDDHDDDDHDDHDEDDDDDGRLHYDVSHI